MRIKLDKKHYLNSDTYSYWITCEYEIKTGKRKGSVDEKRVSGYEPTFEMAVESYIDKKINGSDAAEVAQLVKEIKDLKTEVRGWKNSLAEINKEEAKG